MNKTELIDYIQSNTGLSNAGATRFLHITLLAITRTLKHGEDVTLMGFGRFRAVKRAGRAARNPRTGEAIKTKASRAIQFSAGKDLRQAVN